MVEEELGVHASVHAHAIAVLGVSQLGATLQEHGAVERVHLPAVVLAVQDEAAIEPVQSLIGGLTLNGGLELAQLGDVLQHARRIHRLAQLQVRLSIQVSRLCRGSVSHSVSQSALCPSPHSHGGRGGEGGKVGRGGHTNIAVAIISRSREEDEVRWKVLPVGDVHYVADLDGLAGEDEEGAPSQHLEGLVVVLVVCPVARLQMHSC